MTGSQQTSPFPKYGPALQSSFVARGLSYVKIALTKIGHFLRGSYFNGCDADFPTWVSGLGAVVGRRGGERLRGRGTEGEVWAGIGSDGEVWGHGCGRVLEGS